MTVLKPKKPNQPGWLDPAARTGFLNLQRKRLGEKYTEKFKSQQKSWSWKGSATRIFGQGIQRVFKDLPATNRGAVSGSMAVALYDMTQNKQDLTWVPPDVDTFLTLTQKERQYPLATIFPQITKWLRSVQGQGLPYKLKRNGTIYSKQMCIFDFECEKADTSSKLRLPKISFIAHPETTVRQICNQFDLPICGPILKRRTRNSPIDISVTPEIRQLFKKRCFYSKVLPTNTTRRGKRSKKRVAKYIERGFEYFHTGIDETAVLPYYDDFLELPANFYWPHHPACKQFIISSLGREPTTQECVDFNIAM